MTTAIKTTGDEGLPSLIEIFEVTVKNMEKRLRSERIKAGLRARHQRVSYIASQTQL